jgi:two-component system response regulator GlrR
LGFGLLPKKKEAEPSGQSKRLVKVLVVDQDASLRRVMTAHLKGADYAVSTAETGQAALDACVRSRPNLVISELRLHDMDGLALLKELKSRWPHITVIILTSHATIPEAVQATQGGAFSFLVKPIGKHELMGHVERATAASNFSSTGEDWQDQIASRSRLLEERLAIANRAAASTEPLLLTGASGTGKELLARAIHAASARRNKPFLAVSCTATAEAGLGKEIFARAHEGTLLLDEVGDLSQNLQLELLRVLRKDRSREADDADVRVVCATSRDLKADLETGGFLRELFDRISVLPIEMPPLGRRREDIPLLISHFLEQVKEPGGHEKIYTPEAIELLATTDWPANVKQLFDLVKQNVALSRGKIIAQGPGQQLTPEDPGKIPTYEEAREAFARAYLADNLQRTSGNVTQAARIAKRTRTDFYKLLAKYRLRPDDFKPSSRDRRDE